MNANIRGDSRHAASRHTLAVHQSSRKIFIFVITCLVQIVQIDKTILIDHKHPNRVNHKVYRLLISFFVFFVWLLLLLTAECCRCAQITHQIRLSSDVIYSRPLKLCGRIGCRQIFCLRSTFNSYVNSNNNNDNRLIINITIILDYSNWAWRSFKWKKNRPNRFCLRKSCILICD